MTDTIDLIARLRLYAQGEHTGSWRTQVFVEAADAIASLEARIAELEREEAAWRAAAVDQQGQARRARAALVTARDEGREAMREQAVQCAASWRRPSVVKLAAGEVTAQELRTAIAVAGGIEGAIRALKAPAPPKQARYEDDPRYPALLADAQARVAGKNLDGSPRRQCVPAPPAVEGE